MGIVILPNRTQVVSGAVTVSTTTPATVQLEQPLDDDGNPYVNPNVPGADIATGDKQTQEIAAIQALATTGVPVTNFPAVQPISATALPLPAGAMQQTGGSVSIVGPVTTGTPATPTITQNDDRTYDDDGFPYVNPNVPGADIATGDKQSQILAAVQANQPRTVNGAVSLTGVVSVAAVSTVLAPNAAQESAGQMQRVADLLEAVLVELRIVTIQLGQQGQPRVEDAEALRADLNLSIN